MLQYPFYTEGTKKLLVARIDIAKHFIAKATLRLQRARRKGDDQFENVDAEIDYALKQAGSLVLDCSEIGDDRPLSGCSFSRNGELLATWYLFLLRSALISIRADLANHSSFLVAWIQLSFSN